MEAALRAQSCGPRCLSIQGAWKWLLERFADVYGIRSTYATLSYLRWILMCAPALFVNRQGLHAPAVTPLAVQSMRCCTQGSHVGTLFALRVRV